MADRQFRMPNDERLRSLTLADAVQSFQCERADGTRGTAYQMPAYFRILLGVVGSSDQGWIQGGAGWYVFATEDGHAWGVSPEEFARLYKRLP